MKNVLTAYHKRKLPHVLIGIFSVLVIGIAITFTITAVPRQQIAGIATTTALNTVRITPTTVVNGLKLFTTITTVPKISAKPTSAATPSRGVLQYTPTTQTPSPTNTSTTPVETGLRHHEVGSTLGVKPVSTMTPTIAEQMTTTPTPSPTPTIATVSLQIQTPDETNNATITLTNGATVCDVLQEAKNEGKIASVTFDDTYMASLHSKYVVEINGYSNNWTFTVNGSSPLGCSLSNPKPNDSIVWKFG